MITHILMFLVCCPRLQHQYKETRQVIRKSLTLLRAMAMNNADVENRIFESLDFLLSIEGAESELGQLISEVGQS